MIGAELEYGNYTPVMIQGNKEIVTRFVGDDPENVANLQGIVMTLTGTTGAGATVGTLTAVTNSGGLFKFNGLRPGTYTIGEQGTQDLNNDGIDDVANQGLVIDLNTETVTVESGEVVDFSALEDDDLNPLTPPVPIHVWQNYIETSIHGRKFHDLDGDGIANDLVDHDNDPSTPDRQAILEGVAFQLYRYLGTATQVNPTNPLETLTTFNWEFIRTEFSDVHGDFWFTGLKPGLYTVRENLTIPGPMGEDYSDYVQSTLQTQGSPIAGSTPENPFGDNPGEWESNMISLQNVMTPLVNVNLNYANGGQLTYTPEAISALPTPPALLPAIVPKWVGMEVQWADGQYDLPMDLDDNGNIEPSEKDAANIATALKAGYTLSAQNTAAPDTNDLSELDARPLLWGNYLPVDVEGDKYHDLNGNGELDAGETGFANVIFVLYNQAGTAPILTSVPTTTGPGTMTMMVPVTATTDANGHFIFSGVAPGSYTVLEANGMNGEPVQDTNGDNIDDVAFQDLVLVNNVPVGFTVTSGMGFDFSAPVDDMNPNTVDEPTRIWFNYVEGSIHGRKFHDIDGDGVNNDFDVVTTTAILQNAPLGNLPTDTSVIVDDSSVFPTTYPYEITIGDEVLTVLNNNVATNTLTVAPRGVPMTHIIGAIVTGPTTNPATLIPAVLADVKFDLYKFVGSTKFEPPTFTPAYTRYKWTLVDMEISDVHGDFWFTDLEPGTYVVRENQASLAQMGLEQSTLQPQGNPSYFLDTAPPSMMVPTDDPTNPGIGEDPLDPATGAIVVESTQEYVWQVDAHIMPMDSMLVEDEDEMGNPITVLVRKVDPNINNPDHPNYDPAFNPSIHGQADGNIDDFEQAWAAARQGAQDSCLGGRRSRIRQLHASRDRG